MATAIIALRERRMLGDGGACRIFSVGSRVPSGEAMGG